MLESPARASLKTLRSRGHVALRDVLSEVRRKAGLTTRQLGERLGRPHTYVAKIEGGERSIDPLECRQWAKACGITPRAFWYRLEATLDLRP